MASNQQNIISAVSIAAGEKYNLDVHLSREGIKKFVFLFEVAYQATASTTGLSCDIIPGYGGSDPACLIGVAPHYLALPVVPGTSSAGGGGSTVPTFSDNKYAVTMATMPGSSGTPVTKRTHGYLNDILKVYPDWARFQFTNLDATNGCLLTVKAAISNAV